MANVGDNPVCIDSAAGPEDMQKPIKLWPCHGGGGNQVPKDTQNIHLYPTFVLASVATGLRLRVSITKNTGFHTHHLLLSHYTHVHSDCGCTTRTLILYASGTNLIHLHAIRIMYTTIQNYISVDSILLRLRKRVSVTHPTSN